VWIIIAWQCISLNVTVKAFKKCCISNGMDGTDDMLRNGSEDTGNVGSECEEDEGTDCEDEKVTLLVKVDRF
jgi:hypothetical protein